jgi:hypothetical protein
MGTVDKKMTLFRSTFWFLSWKRNGIERKNSHFQGHNIVFQDIYPEDGSSMFLQNICIHLQDSTVTT